MFMFCFVYSFLVRMKDFLVFFVFLEFEVESGATVVSLTCFGDFLTQFDEGGSPPGDVSRR